MSGWYFGPDEPVQVVLINGELVTNYHEMTLRYSHPYTHRARLRATIALHPRNAALTVALHSESPALLTDRATYRLPADHSLLACWIPPAAGFSGSNKARTTLSRNLPPHSILMTSKAWLLDPSHPDFGCLASIFKILIRKTLRKRYHFLHGSVSNCKSKVNSTST